MLYVVEVIRNKTVVHRVDLRNGKYLAPKVLNGTFETQANDLVWMVGRDGCEKIVFDTCGVGKGLADWFDKIVANPNSRVKVDDKGNVFIHGGIEGFNIDKGIDLL